ncbi:hypothetical protein [Sphaerospermopsis sp. LEGE 08334]|jgi:hypothetical protein|uniref:hypothetical protein n=1 Tax=Sphaerospermopsis sp. LEGE 08334 TaxID=1828651 RepID=UPI00187FB280|nr:hypothetical protein [Sphaerospermopsis sp. LEGE 08334]MBE9059095.1 hypothetical protein [Sphaerospermopsis sp. LEGE 08334]
MSKFATQPTGWQDANVKSETSVHLIDVVEAFAKKKDCSNKSNFYKNRTFLYSILTKLQKSEKGQLT